MIRTLHRTRGASALGARHDGETGPYGVRGLDDEEPDEDDDEPTCDFLRSQEVPGSRKNPSDQDDH